MLLEIVPFIGRWGGAHFLFFVKAESPVKYLCGKGSLLAIVALIETITGRVISEMYCQH